MVQLMVDVVNDNVERLRCVLCVNGTDDVEGLNDYPRDTMFSEACVTDGVSQPALIGDKSL